MTVGKHAAAGATDAAWPEAGFAEAQRHAEAQNRRL